MSEAFANPQCAELLNKSFLPIIVDREERPDIDTIYMNYMQAVNGAGGWPMNLFLTPDLAPVFGGTYWPGPGTSHSAGEEGEDGLDFLTILKKLMKVWKDQEVRCRTEAKGVLTQLREFAAEGTLGDTARDSDFPAILTPPSAAIPFGGPGASTSQGAGSELDLDDLEKAYDHIARTFDPVAGGFGIMPKFPTPPKLTFLLRLSQLPTEVQDVVGEVECAHAREMTLFTLRKMRDRALRDHVGGEGMLRYSVNSDWTVPNFEKLVVDNALLLGLYLDAWLSSGANPAGEFLDVVAELAEYLSSPPICLPEGGFASSEAADSYYGAGEKVLQDGAYYLWTRREFDAAVGNGQEGTIAATYWNVLEHGNVESSQDPHDVFINRNVLHVTKDMADLSRQIKVPVDQVRKAITSAKAKLKKYRDEKRVRPEIDDKVIASWNGLVVSALARTAMAVKHIDDMNHMRYLDAAVNAAKFIKEKLWDSREKILYRIYRGGRGTTKGLAEDYAFMIEGLLDLYHATWDEAWLQWADELQGNFTTRHSFAGYMKLTMNCCRNPNKHLLRRSPHQRNAINLGRILLHARNPPAHHPPPQRRNGHLPPLHQRRLGLQPLPTRHPARRQPVRCPCPRNRQRLRGRGLAPSVALPRAHGGDRGLASAGAELGFDIFRGGERRERRRQGEWRGCGGVGGAAFVRVLYCSEGWGERNGEGRGTGFVGGLEESEVESVVREGKQ